MCLYLLIFGALFLTVYFAAKFGITVVMEEYKEEFRQVLLEELNKQKVQRPRPKVHSENDMRAYLQEMGLTVLSYIGGLRSYEMTEEIASQAAEVDSFWYWLGKYEGETAHKYIGKVITEHKFQVKGHPDEKFCYAESSVAWLLTVDDQILGGYTVPDDEEHEGDFSFFKKD